MRVLMTADTVGGVWTYAMDLCGALAEQEVDTTLVTLGRPMSPDQKRCASARARLEVIEVPCKLEWMEDPWDDLCRASEVLLDTAVRVRPEVVHLSSFVHASLPWGAMGMPVVLVGHSCVETWWRAVKGSPADARWDRYREAVGRGIRDADVFVAPTRAMLDAFTNCYGAHHDGRVIHNGRDASLYRPGSKQPWVLAAGRLWDEAKNIALLEAASCDIQWPVRLAGEGHQARGQSPPGLTSLGKLTPAQLAAEMAMASIYAAPAKYEPFGLSAVEAALSGCALVLGDIATLREVWGDAAVFVDPTDRRALANAVNSLIADEPRRRALAAAAYRRAQRYTVGAMAKKYLSLYRAMARERPAAAVEEGVTA